jgi:alcohol dehydrogenase YqhD (iron-dependent ADH family)
MPWHLTLCGVVQWFERLIKKGVPNDSTTHMIGHELTAMYEIDHARTLAIIAPSLYKVMFETKSKTGTIWKTHLQLRRY